MTKAELRTGMRVTTKGGKKFIVLLNCQHDYDDSTNIFVNDKTNGWNSFDYYNYDLTCVNDCDSIVKAEQPFHPYKVFNVISSDFRIIWTRQAPKQMTISEVEKALGYKIEIV